MKTLFLAGCILCASAAFGQVVAGSAVLTNQPQIFQFESHEQHASQRPMGEYRTLETYDNVSAHGVRPLWEVAPLSQEPPLGDAARSLRKQHATAKKAQVVWEN